MTATPPLPTFAIVGAARAGTTAIAETLRSHPDVFMTQPKEPHYLALGGQPANFTGPGDDSHINQMAVTERDDYLALFADSDGSVARGEASVSTLYYPEHSIATIKELNPQLRLVVILREPVSRAFSSYQYLRVRGFEPIPDFLDAVAEEPARRELGWHHLWHYTQMSTYAADLEQFLTAFGDQVGVWFYDDFTARPDGTVDEISTFIGVDPARAESTSVQRVNASGQPRSAAVQAVVQWGGRQAALRSALKRVVPFALRERIRGANLQATTLDETITAQLRPTFAKDLVRLEELLGRPVPADWTS